MNIRPRALHMSAMIGLLLVFGVVLLRNAWLVDDAYITFRTVDNVANGYGLTWNVDERVQVYTHPLWMLLVTLAYLVTSEIFFTVIGLSALLMLSATLIVWTFVTGTFRNDWWKGLLLVTALTAAKAVLDFASSGLENVLSYLIGALFAVRILALTRQERIGIADLRLPLLLTSLAFVNRPDTVLLYAPALLYLLYCVRKEPWGAILRTGLIATVPAWLWLGFSLFYYGFPFPNTAYAKMFSTGFPTLWKLQRGVEYLTNSLLWDTASYVMLAAAFWLSIRSRSRGGLALLAGVLAYIAFVLYSAASATHMSGRFFAAPLFIAVVVMVALLENRRVGLIATAALAAYLVWSPVSALKFGTPAYQRYEQNASFIDTKWYVYNEGAALLNWRPGLPMPNHSWYQYGEALRNEPGKVHLGGAYGWEAIGYVGFAAGPGKHFIDPVGLSDPLLARLPGELPEDPRAWKSGHFHRQVPEGYVESIALNMNCIREPNLHAYYDVVRLITRGPLLSPERFQAIVAMNFGQYQDLIRDLPVTAGAPTTEQRQMADLQPQNAGCMP